MSKKLIQLLQDVATATPVKSAQRCNFLRSPQLSCKSEPAAVVSHKFHQSQQSPTKRHQAHFLVLAVKTQTWITNASHVPTKITARDHARKFTYVHRVRRCGGPQTPVLPQKTPVDQSPRRRLFNNLLHMLKGLR